MHDSRRVLLALIVILMLIFITGCSSSVTVKGKVISGESSVSNVTVHLKYDQESVEATTGEDGSFVFNDVGAGSRVLTLTTTIDERECTVTKTIRDDEAGQTITADIKLPMELKPPEAVAAGGVGYIAGDLTIIC
jgi:hypothetical protein